jgi:DNA primase
VNQHYTKDTLYRLRNKIPITKLIVDILDISTKTQDGYLRFLCPLCSEFMTACNPKTNLARCFRCEQNFNTIDLTMLVKRMPFKEAVRFLLNFNIVSQEGDRVEKGN